MVLHEQWNVRMKSMGKSIGIRFVDRFFVTEHNNRNRLLAGDVPQS